MAKIIKITDLEATLVNIRSKKIPLILVGGCFDILHPGHGLFLQKAKELGGVLFVLLESDEVIRRKKGTNRPIQPQNDRAYLLSLLEPVDYILSLPPFSSHDDYYTLVKKIKPDIIAITSGDPITEIIKDQASQVNAKVIEVISRQDHYSTSQLVKNL